MGDTEKKAITSVAAAAAATLIVGTGPIGTLAGAATAIMTLAGWKQLGELERALVESLPEEARLYLPAMLIALIQMRKDLARSPLLSRSLAEHQEEFIESSMSVLNPDEHMTIADIELKRITAGRLWAVASQEDIALLKEMCGEKTPFRVDCQSIAVGIYAALISMQQRHDVRFHLDPGSASGRETAITEGFKDDDLIITADAAMILGVESFRFKKLFTVTTEAQSVLCKRGGQHRDRRKVFLYPLSSVDHQMRELSRQRGSGAFQFPYSTIEKHIEDLADYLTLDYTMEPGDYVIAWDPLRTHFLNQDVFEEVPNSNFDLALSMFQSDRTKFSQGHIDAFLRLFIAEINYVRSHPLTCWKNLWSDEPFRNSLIRGAALRFKKAE